MKTIIAGGRDNHLTIEDWAYLSTLHITEVVSGHARGIDKDGEAYAKATNLPVKIFKADWTAFGKQAGFIRNGQMAQYADAVVLFNGGAGTRHMAAIAKDHGLMIYDRRTK